MSLAFVLPILLYTLWLSPPSLPPSNVAVKPTYGLL